MNCDFIDLKQETINYKGVNLENLFSSCIWATDELPIVGSTLEASVMLE